MEAAYEAGKDIGDEGFPELGLPAGEEVDFFEPPAKWSKDDLAYYHYVLGNYCMYRLSDSYLNKGIASFEKGFPALVKAKDAARATRTLARVLRQCAYASFSLPSAFEKTEAMFARLDWMRENAPREDVEELDLSIAEMLTRMGREGPFNNRESLIRAYEIVRPTLSRLLATPPSRQKALPYSLTGFWLVVDELWTDDDLGEVQKLFGETGREELRRHAYYKACELEDGSFYRVGSATPTEHRKLEGLRRAFGNLLTQYRTLGDEAGSKAAIARWGKTLGKAAVADAIEEAKANAQPAPETAQKPAAKKGAAKKPAAKQGAAKKPAARKAASKKAAPAAKRPTKAGAKKSGGKARR
jgi:hypothetical protein